MKHASRLLLLLLLPALLLLSSCNKNEPHTGKDDNSPSEYQLEQMKKSPIAYDAATLVSFSAEPGVYNDAITVTLSVPSPDLVIRYTTDCEDPDAESKSFTEPLLFSYLEDTGDQNCDVTVYNIRAAAFDQEGKQVGRVVCASYIFPKTPDRFTTKIAAIVSDPDHLYGKKGIITNKGLHGKAGERPVNVQFYSADGVLTYQQDLGMRLNGAWARNMAQKNFRFFARKEYSKGDAYLSYPLFPGLTAEKDGSQIETFDSFIIRGGATNFGNSMITSPIAYEMMEDSAVDAGNFEAVTLFLNGEYYGVMMYLEDYDPYYFESHYGPDADSITTIQYTIVGGNPQTNWDPDDCTDDEFEEWARVRTMLIKNDMTKAYNYEMACKVIDIDNFIEYLVFNCYVDNWDWPRNNQRIWRYNALPDGRLSTVGGYDPTAEYGYDGRWRFVIKDLDISHGISGERELNYTSYVTTDFFQVVNKDSWSLNDCDLMLANLMKNPEFCQKFYLYLCEFMTGVANVDNHLERINTIAMQVSKEMVYHHQKYNQSFDYYNQCIQTMRDFAELRPGYVLDDVNSYSKQKRYGIQVAKVSVIGLEHGTIVYNNVTIEQDQTAYTIIDLPLTMTVIPDPGYTLSRIEMSGGKWNDGEPIFSSENCAIRFTFRELKQSEEQATLPTPSAPTPTAPMLNEIGFRSTDAANGSDWIELYNPTSADLGLRGYVLAVGDARYEIPDILIPAQGYKVFFANGSDTGGVYLPFELSDGDTLQLLDPEGNPIDSCVLLTRSDSAHIGRYPDGGEWVELTTDERTPATANYHLYAPQHHISDQVINTVMVNGITLDPALFSLREDGKLTVKKSDLIAASLHKAIDKPFLELFSDYADSDVIDLSEWAEGYQKSRTVRAYFVKGLNSYVVYIPDVDFDDLPY